MSLLKIYLEALEDSATAHFFYHSRKQYLLFIKNIFDVLAAAFALLLLAPLLCLVAVLVKVTSPGPVIFRSSLRFGRKKVCDVQVSFDDC